MKPDWDKLATKADSSTVTIADVDCTTPEGESVCQRFEVRGYPTIKYFNDKSGKKGSDYQGGRDFDSLLSFTKSTFKAACDPATKKGCNEQEVRFIEKMAEKSKDELEAEKSTKEDELKEVKDEKKAGEKEFKEKSKAWKRKETALGKAITILKTMLKGKKDEL